MVFMDVKHFIPSEMLILSAGTIVGSGILDKTGKRKNNLSIALTPSTSVSQSGTRDGWPHGFLWCLIKMQIPWFHLDLLNPNTWRWNQGICILKKALQTSTNYSFYHSKPLIILICLTLFLTTSPNYTVSWTYHRVSYLHSYAHPLSKHLSGLWRQPLPCCPPNDQGRCNLFILWTFKGHLLCILRDIYFVSFLWYLTVP